MPWPAPSVRPLLTSLFAAKPEPVRQESSPPTVQLEGVTFDMVGAASPRERTPSGNSLDTLDSAFASSSGSAPSRRSSSSSWATSVASSSTAARRSAQGQGALAPSEPRALLAALHLRRPSAPLPPAVPSAPLLRSAPFPGAERQADAPVGPFRRVSAPARPQRPPQLPQLARGLQPACAEPKVTRRVACVTAEHAAQANAFDPAPFAADVAWTRLLRDAGESAQARRIPRRRTDSPPPSGAELPALAGPSLAAHAPGRPSRLREVALPAELALTRPALCSPPPAPAWASGLPWLLASAPDGRPTAQAVARRHFYRAAGNVAAGLAQLAQASADHLPAAWRQLAGDFAALNVSFCAAWPELPPRGPGPSAELADKDAQHLVELWTQLACIFLRSPGLLRGTVRLSREVPACGEGGAWSMACAGTATLQLPPAELEARLRAAAPALPALALALRAFAEGHAQLGAHLA